MSCLLNDFRSFLRLTEEITLCSQVQAQGLDEITNAVAPIPKKQEKVQLDKKKSDFFFEPPE
ncbi:MAG: hypothetical protein C0403_19220 [Desulfobacterium sp.]|nr:hypothetical protein [Desulfobacterium sp.]